jgi:ankyrin repeat protein
MPDNANDSLIAALKSDNTAAVLQELAAGRALTERFHFGRTPLHIASENGATECVRLLVERGAPLEARDEAGHTPLIYALAWGHAKSAGVLIESAALLTYRHIPDDTPAIREQLRRVFENASTASKAAHPEIYQVLDDASLDLDREAFQKELADSLVSSAISLKEIHAVHHCANLETLQLLARLPGVTFDLHDGAGYWPLKSFAERGDFDAVNWLLRHGASPDFTSTGETALHSAVANNHSECAQLLLDAGANPNQQDVDGCVPMWRVRNDAMLDLLLAHGANPNIPDQCGNKPSHWVEDPKLKSRLQSLEREHRRRK